MLLPAIEYRYYYRFSTLADQLYAPGICFYLPAGTQVVNFPKQHSENCTAEAPNYGRVVQTSCPPVYKNMRNHLVERRLVLDGLAPSYFIEGLLYNVPDDNFGRSFDATFVASFNFLQSADRSTFKCANGIHPLLGNSHTSWLPENCQNCLFAVREPWNSWK